jgi:hypothetical protein
LHAVSQEGDEDMGFDPRFFLIEHRPDCPVALDIAAGLREGNELDVVLP